MKRWGYYYREKGKRRTVIKHPRTGQPFRSQTDAELWIRYLKILEDEPDINTFERKQWILENWDAFSPRERIAVLFVHYKGECQYCGKRVLLDYSRSSSRSKATIDHRLPLTGGGADSFDNCILACHACNTSKGSSSFEVFSNKLNGDSL